MKKSTPTLILAAVMMSSVIMGCSENDLVENAPQNKAVTLTTTISLDGSSATTRALDADGKKTFAADEQVALVYQDANNAVQKAVSAKLKAGDISSDKKKATLTFTINNPKAGGDFAMIYPASMAQDPLPSTGTFDDMASPNYAALTNQDGTLASLSSNLDLASCKSAFTSNATLPGGISLTNQLAITELTIKDYAGTSDLTSTITGLTVKVGTGASAPTYTVSRTAAAGPIYVAMQPCSASDITVTATDGTANYEKTVNSQSLTASTMTPVTAKMFKVVDLASVTSDYEAKNGEMLTGTLGASVSISIAAGATVMLRNVNINGDGNLEKSCHGITCKGNATIILEGTNEVRGFGSAYAGVHVAPNKTLTIQGVGSLVATGGSGSSTGGAGIGSGYQGKCGNIKIEGGNITATGGRYASGIGYSGNIDSSGDITISGGTITAIGGVRGAGIGSGDSGTCGNITISGGTIEKAQGGSYGAGIGSGNQGTCGDITITTGATITKAQGGSYGAGIGSGNGNTSKCGTISICGGEIKEAQGGAYGAGIGSGSSKCDEIIISGGIITSALGGYNGAGIGSGSFGTCGAITISGGTIEKAQGDSGGAGIGSGDEGTCGAITITTGVTKVTATKGGNAASNSIGSGDSGTCGTVTIEAGANVIQN